VLVVLAVPPFWLKKPMMRVICEEPLGLERAISSL